MLQKLYLLMNNNFLKNFPLLKTKLIGLKKNSGKNNTGKTTSFHKGGGHKRNYRKIDFSRKINRIGVVTCIEYDPNRTAYLASIYNFITKNYYYIIAPNKLATGDIIKSGLNAEIKLGHSLPVSKIPEGTLINNVSQKEKRKAKMTRSAGNFSIIIEKTSKYIKIKLSSGEFRKLPIHCYASIGTVSNNYHYLTYLKKAGKSRWLNKRPIVRGVAMNPIDHPNGGGEGKSSGKNMTPWGIPNKRKKSVKKKINNETKR